MTNTNRVRPGLWVLTFLSLPLIGSPGSWSTLGTERVEIAGPNGREAFEHSLADMPGILRKFHPANPMITGSSVQERGPRGLPRLELQLRKGEIRTDVTVTDLHCNAPAAPKGYRVDFDLTQSDEVISKNFDTYRIEICALDQPDGGIVLMGSSSVKEHSDANPVIGVLGKRFIQSLTNPTIQAVTDSIGDCASAGGVR